jgi:low temperature requirement protein LtrA
MTDAKHLSHHAPPMPAPLHATMTARSPDEPHRASTPLELFFDLVFVVAIGQAAAGLHHAVAENHAAQGLMGYSMVFFAIWWAWMNFTWFASAYDVDDVPYRLTVFVQIAGALILAAGVPAMFEHRSINGVILTGYVVMRVAMVVQWLRAARADPPRRGTALRYASGIAVLQVAWVALLFVPWLHLAGFFALALLEALVPAWAETSAATTWHPQHIAERYGLLTLIVLGESILSATVAVQSALASGEALPGLVPIIVGGLLTAYSIWWMYFDRPVHDLLTSLRQAIRWGYGHYFIFASAAAVGAGLAVGVDQATHHAEIGSTAAGFAVAIPVAVFVTCLWLIHDRPEYRESRPLGMVAVVLIVLTPLTSQAILLTGVVLASLVSIKLLIRHQSERLPAPRANAAASTR